MRKEDFIQQVKPYITDTEIGDVTEYLRSGGWLTEFEKTREFEEEISHFLRIKYCTVVTSGTVALYTALLALEVGKGDKVLVPNYTMIASINAIKWCGAEPVIIDIDKLNLCIDIEKIELDSKAKAIMYVSINGRSGDMNKIVKFCRDNNLFLIEDACQSLASKSGAQYLGTFGDIGVFSFTPHKIITTGQGGALVTARRGFYEKAEKIKDFYRTSPGCDWHDGIGYNFKFTDLQAVIGIAQMKIIDFRVKQKKGLFKRYRQRLADLETVYFLPTDLEEATPWFADIILPSPEIRDKLAAYLKSYGIGSRIFYPPINHQKPYSYYPRGSFAVSESICYRGLWLPSSVGLSDETIDYICDKIKVFFKK